MTIDVGRTRERNLDENANGAVRFGLYSGWWWWGRVLQHRVRVEINRREK